MMMRKAGTIDQSTDFQLAYTACVRTFCAEQEPDMLKKLKQLYVDYLPYWETKTLFVAARDLLDSLGYSPYDFSPYPFGISQESDLGKAMFPFVSSLLECIKARSQTDEGKYCTIREFRLEKTPFGGHIYRENGLPYEAFSVFASNPYVPIKNVEDVDFLAYSIVRYSCGRHTYMPSAATTFVWDNREYLFDLVIDQIITYLQNATGESMEGCDDMMHGLLCRLEAYREKKKEQKSEN